MFEKRLNSALELKTVIKVQKQKIVNDLTREFLSVSSSNAKKDYKVVIAANPSCTCSNFEKNGSKTYCKHIICLVLYVLGGASFEKMLKERYLSEDDLKCLFRNKEIPVSYCQPEPTTENPQNSNGILQPHTDPDEKRQCLCM